jgi:hypothetical protein
MTGSLAEAGDEVKRGAELAAKLSRPDGLSPWGDGRAAPGLANCV